MRRWNQVLFAAVIVIQLFFLVDGASLFPSYWESQGWGQWMPVYFALTAGALVLSLFLTRPVGAGQAAERTLLPDPLGLFPIGLVYFFGAFLLAVILFQIPALRVPLSIPRGDALPTALFTIFVVAFTETLLFIWLLIPFLASVMPMAAAVAASSGAWTLFHLARYGEQPEVLVFIFLLGIALGLAFVVTRREGGMMAPWGFHAGWNLGTYGAVTISQLALALLGCVR